MSVSVSKSMEQQSQKEKVILTVSIINAVTNILLALLKIIVGWLGNSQALIADGVHSFSDVVSDVLVYASATASIRGPDKEHPYGHQRIETIGTMVVALILLIVAVSIGYEAISHLMIHLHERPTTPVIIAAVFSIVLNEGLFYYSAKEGKKIESNLLISNAWHKRSDVFISLIVLISVIGAMSGLTWLDAVGALIVTAIILKVSIKMLWDAGQELIDHAVDSQTLEEIKKTIKSVPGVCSIHELRTRRHGQSIFVDLHIIVSPYISVSEGHHIGDQVRETLLNSHKNIRDVVVHIDPENDEESHPSLHLPNREALKKILEMRWKDLPHYHDIKKIHLHYLNGMLSIEVMMNIHQPLHDFSHQYHTAISDLNYIRKLDLYYGTEK